MSRILGAILLVSCSLTPLQADPPVIKLTGPTGAVPGDIIVIDASQSVGVKFLKWIPLTKLPDNLVTILPLENNTKCLVNSRPGTWSIAVAASNADGVDMQIFTVSVGVSPTPIPTPVPPNPQPVPPVPPVPTPTDDFTTSVKAAFGNTPAAMADATKWASLYSIMSEAIQNDTTLTTTLNVYTRTLSEERKLVLDINKYPSLINVVQKELAPYVTVQNLTPALREQMVASCQKLGNACAAAGGK